MTLIGGRNGSRIEDQISTGPELAVTLDEYVRNDDGGGTPEHRKQMARLRRKQKRREAMA